MTAAAARSSSAGPARRPLQRQSSNDTSGRDFLQENKLGAGAPVRPKLEGGNGSKGDDGLKYIQKADFGRVPVRCPAALRERWQLSRSVAEGAFRYDRTPYLALLTTSLFVNIIDIPAGAQVGDDREAGG